MVDWEDPLEKEIRKILEKMIKNFTIISEIDPGEAQFFGYERIEITLPNGKKIIKERRTPSISNPPTLNAIKESQLEHGVSSFLSDVIQTPNEVIVIAEVPTLNERDVNFEIKDGTVRIFCNGEMIHEIKIENDVDPTSIKKEFKNRILELKIPLKKKSK